MSHFLYIKVIHASQLLAADLDGTSDPYVKVSLGSNSVKTSTVKSCLAPVWNQSFVLPVTSFQDPLIFQVYDKDTFGSDDSLGAVQFHLHGMQEGNEIYKVFKLYGGEYGSNVQAALQKQSKSAKKNATTAVATETATNVTGNATAGKLMGKLMHHAQKLGEATAKPDLEEQQNIQLGINSTTPGVLGRVDLNHGILTVAICLFSNQATAKSFTPRLPPSQGQLTVRILGARNLLAADLGHRPSSDPYCVLTIGSQRFTTKAISSTLNPDWNQVFGFNNLQKGDELVLSVWDRDKAGSDDSLGDGSVSLTHLPIGQEMFFAARLVGGESGENLQSVVSDNMQPVGQNIAAVTASNAIGGEAGKLAGQLIKKIPQGKENRNKGTVIVGLTLSSPLGSNEASPAYRGLPADTPVPVVESADECGSPL